MDWANEEDEESLIWLTTLLNGRIFIFSISPNFCVNLDQDNMVITIERIWKYPMKMSLLTMSCSDKNRRKIWSSCKNRVLVTRHIEHVRNQEHTEKLKHVAMHVPLVGIYSWNWCVGGVDVEQHIYRFLCGMHSTKYVNLNGCSCYRSIVFLFAK
jgi:hypothetical protein